MAALLLLLLLLLIIIIIIIIVKLLTNGVRFLTLQRCDLMVEESKS